MTDRPVPILLHLQVASQAIAEHVLHAGFDGAVIDLQHGEVGTDAGVRIARSWPRDNPHLYARLAGLDAGVIGRLLDSGVSGVIAPSIESGEQAARLVAATKYPPQGVRSFGPTRPLRDPGSGHHAAANARVRAIAQIETARGLANADAIMATPGLDGLYLGPADLGISLGVPGLDAAEGPVREAVLDLSRRARARSLAFGVFCVSPTYAAGLVRDGLVDFVPLASDLILLSRAAADVVGVVRG